MKIDVKTKCLKNFGISILLPDIDLQFLAIGKRRNWTYCCRRKYSEQDQFFYVNLPQLPRVEPHRHLYRRWSQSMYHHLQA